MRGFTRGTAVADTAGMRSCYAIAWLILRFWRRARRRGPQPPPLPGAGAFTGCNKYPRDKEVQVERARRGRRLRAGGVARADLLPADHRRRAACAARRQGRPSMCPISDRGEVYRLFYNALESMGLTVERRAGTSRSSTRAAPRRWRSRRSRRRGVAPDDDRYVIRMLHPRARGAAELAELLAKSKEGDGSVYGAGGALMVTDRAENVRRMEEVRARSTSARRARASSRCDARADADGAGSVAGEDPRRGGASQRAGRRRADGKGASDRCRRSTGTCRAGAARRGAPGRRHRQRGRLARVQAVATRIDPPADDDAARKATSSTWPTPTPKRWRRRYKRSGSAAAPARHGRPARPARRRRRRR